MFVNKNKVEARRGAGAIAAVVGMVWLSGCCRKEYAGVVVLNDTGAPLSVKVAGSEYDPWEVGAGQDVIIPGPEGPSVLHARPAQDAAAKPQERPVSLRLDRLALVAYPPQRCYVVVDHTDQYEGQGALQVLARTGPEFVGELESLPLQGVTYLHPDQKLPPTSSRATAWCASPASRASCCPRPRPRRCSSTSRGSTSAGPREKSTRARSCGVERGVAAQCLGAHGGREARQRCPDVDDGGPRAARSLPRRPQGRAAPHL